MNIVNKKINELKPYQNNPRINEDSVKLVANSIKEFGFKVPIVIDKNNVIIAGHTRYKASQELQLEEVPCIVADDLNEEQIKAYRLADNKVGELSSWDYELLDDELDDIEIDMSDFGFDDINIDDDYIDGSDEVQDISKNLLKCPSCGHINEEKAFKNYEDTE